MNALLTKIALLAEVIVEFVIVAVALTVAMILARAIWYLATARTGAVRAKRRVPPADTSDPRWSTLGTELRVRPAIPMMNNASLSAIALAGRQQQAATAVARQVASEQASHVPTSSAVLRDHLQSEVRQAA